MKKLLALMMALAMTLSLAACGGSDATLTEAPFAPVQAGKTEFTAEQQALAQDFMSMAEEYDAGRTFIAEASAALDEIDR